MEESGHPNASLKAWRMNLTLVGFIACSGAIEPLGFHQSEAMAENFLISDSSTAPLPEGELHYQHFIKQYLPDF